MSCRSILDDHHLEILAGDDQRAILGDVELVEQRVEISLKRLACLRINCLERLQNRSVAGAEKLDPVLG